MADTPNTGGDNDKSAGPEPGPQPGAEPDADPHLNGPGMTNGIPDANSSDSAASPSSDRSTVENAGK